MWSRCWNEKQKFEALDNKSNVTVTLRNAIEGDRKIGVKAYFFIIKQLTKQTIFDKIYKREEV